MFNIPFHIKRARERAEAFNAKIEAQWELDAAKAAQIRAYDLERQLEATRRFISSEIAEDVVKVTNRKIADHIGEKFIKNVDGFFVSDHKHEISQIINFALNRGGTSPVSNSDIEAMRTSLGYHDGSMVRKFDAFIDMVKDMNRFSGAAHRLRECGATIARNMKHYSSIDMRPICGGAIPEIQFTTRVYWDRPLEYACSTYVSIDHVKRRK